MGVTDQDIQMVKDSLMTLDEWAGDKTVNLKLTRRNLALLMNAVNTEIGRMDKIGIDSVRDDLRVIKADLDELHKLRHWR